MRNPWEDIRLDDYEKHMSLDSVMQLQALNSIMKNQFEAYDVHTVMILGVAGGNGLEHIDTDKYTRVYGVDINDSYLKILAIRYGAMGDVLQCLHLDIVKNVGMLPNADLVIANVLIEYIGYSAFQKVLQQVDATYVSCVIQINTDEGAWVSESPYLHAFDGLDAIHHQMEESTLTAAMKEIGYSRIVQDALPLPNGKGLVRLDYEKIQ